MPALEHVDFPGAVRTRHGAHVFDDADDGDVAVAGEGNHLAGIQNRQVLRRGDYHGTVHLADEVDDGDLLISGSGRQVE